MRVLIYVCYIPSFREIFLLGLAVDFHCYPNFFGGGGGCIMFGSDSMEALGLLFFYVGGWGVQFC